MTINVIKLLPILMILNTIFLLYITKRISKCSAKGEQNLDDIIDIFRVSYVNYLVDHDGASEPFFKDNIIFTNMSKIGKKLTG